MKKVDVFHNSCLRRICNIYWPNKISNEELHRKTNTRQLSTEIAIRRLKWLGHVLRMSDDRIPKVALHWAPEGKRKRGRPKTTWRRTVAKDLAAIGIPWDAAQPLAQNRPQWRKLITALCPTWDEEDK